MGQLKKAVSILRENKVSCIMLNEKDEIITSDSVGVKPLMECLRINRQAFSNSVIADKVIGKAAALLIVLGGATGAHGEVMSEEGRAVLEKHHIVYTYKELVPYIENRTRTGRCPMEQAVSNIEDPELAYKELEKTIQSLMKQQTAKQ